MTNLSGRRPLPAARPWSALTDLSYGLNVTSPLQQRPLDALTAATTQGIQLTSGPLCIGARIHEGIYDSTVDADASGYYGM